MEHLILSGTAMTDTGIQRLEVLTRLRSLRVNGTKISDDGVRHSAGRTRLESLWLGQSQVTDAGLEGLATLAELRDLNLATCPRITDAGLEHLRQLSNLEVLSLSDTAISDDGLPRLAALPNLRELSIVETQLTVPAVLKFWQTQPQLSIDCSYGQLHGTRVFLHSGRVTDEHLVYFKGQPRLEGLCLSGTNISDAGVEHLIELTQLNSLDVALTGVTPAGVERLKQARPNCSIHYVSAGRGAVK
jgi:Leucine-rich repeat (LRR) protein